MTGEFRNKIDDKGRLMIPPKLRSEMGDLSELYLTRSHNNSVWLYTKEGFERLRSGFDSNPYLAFESSVTIFKRLVIDPARQVELDKTGRVTIPQPLRKYAGIVPKEECVILGSGDHLEIIGAEAYDAYVLDNIEKLSEAGNAVSNLVSK